MKSNKIKATFIGFIAPMLWATFPSLSIGVGKIPPFQLMSITFGISFVMSLALWKFQGKNPLQVLKQPFKFWLLGIFGIFGFNAIYVSCLKIGPAAELFLIISTWPIVTIILDSLVLKARLRIWHIIGMLSAFLGVVLIVLHNDSADFNTEYFWRYAAAFCGALIWASYSILNRKIKGMPGDLVGGFCGAGCILAFICHSLFEQTAAISMEQVPFFIAMGIGPVGIAYYAWSYGTKYGDMRSLSILSFIGTFISISLMILFGYAKFSPTIAAASVLIIGGAAVGSMGMFLKKS
jgi:drug/metabolite transporter (DMT)-like permease